MARRQIAELRGIVTGASSGIGWALALELASQGARLLVTGRRQAKLDELTDVITKAGGEAYALAGDITRPDVRQQLLAVAGERLGGLDLLVNNAGVGALGPFHDASEDRLRQIMEVNFFAPAELMRAALPFLRRGQRPIIVNISSVLGHRGVPLKSEYCASKFALHGLSDAIRAELSGAGIDLLLVSPSTTQSDFFANVIDGGTSPEAVGPRGMPARTVARQVVRAISRGKHEIILSAGGKLLVWLDRLCPPLMNRLVARFSRHET